MPILILDGAFGTMAQSLRLPAQAYELDGRAAAGCNDVLCLTRPEAVEHIHAQYIDAGADIIETNSFNSNAISLSDYGLQDRAYDLSRAAAQIARRAAGKAGRKVLVAGSMGPTNRSLSISPDVNRPDYREVSYEQMRQAYRDQARGLIDGGADMLLIETAFDTLNAKAAISGIRDASPDIPVMISATLSDASGRTLSGQTVEAFCASVAHARPWSIGLNCGFGAKHLLPYLRRLSAVARCRVSAHPNAGLPNVMGEYDETPEDFANAIEPYLSEGLVDIVGGCCGTTPAHIAALAAKLRAASCELRTTNYELRAASCEPGGNRPLVLAGLEPLAVTPEINFVNIGERTNVAGSAKFAKMIREGDYASAVTVAAAQVEAGAQIIDICMDDAMIDGPAAMARFVNLIASEPAIARVPLMIDSSHWETIEAGLRCAQGKCVVNSISLKEGEEKFLARARAVMGYGAAAVVMLFDEQGQADTYERKVAVAKRAYGLLAGIGFPVEDIIIDPNILAIATGMPEHDGYALAFIEATRWIKANLPGAKVSGGVSNLSFAFRGNNLVRKAMHSAFLYHAIAAGMDMAIVNPQMVLMYDDIDPALLERVEDALLCRRPDAADRLAAYAGELAGQAQATPQASKPEAGERLPVGERIARALAAGDTAAIGADALEAFQAKGSAMAVISDMLMPAMERVGDMFAQGKMFLPQVVKSARAMKQAVDALTAADPGMRADEAASKGTIVVATVKGDVHDIGKNIVSVVLACNGFAVRDLGVMVEADAIVREAKEAGADAIGLSGLITPSLAEMANVAREADRQGARMPIIIGGATTNPLHTAVKIAPETAVPVIHARDAADTARILSILTGPGRDAFIAENAAAQARLRESYELRKANDELRITNDEQPISSFVIRHSSLEEVRHSSFVIRHSLAEVAKAINWAFFLSAWGVPGKVPEVFGNPKYGGEARKVYDDAQAMLADIIANGKLQLRCVMRELPARRDGDDIVLDIDGAERRLPMLRGLSGVCAADMAVDGRATLFALSAGFGLDEMRREYDAKGDAYGSTMAKLLADRLTEAYAETVLPGGCRLAFGYPAVPDHSLKRDVFDILGAEAATGMRLTENCMIIPGEAICGMWLPSGSYASVGRVSAEQVEDYARRRGMPLDEAKKYLLTLI